MLALLDAREGIAFMKVDAAVLVEGTGPGAHIKGIIDMRIGSRHWGLAAGDEGGSGRVVTEALHLLEGFGEHA